MSKRENEISNEIDNWSVGLKGSTRYSKKQMEFILQKLLLKDSERERINVGMLSKIIADLEERMAKIEIKGAPVKVSHFLALAFFTTITSTLLVLIIILILSII
ncbi:MAG: hypothetical protein ACUVTD_04500 [Nitrososphaerales archaeon]